MAKFSGIFQKSPPEVPGENELRVPLYSGEAPRIATGATMPGFFQYPAANFACLRQRRLEPRRLLIQRIRSVGEEPLDPITFELEPARPRGKTLVSGTDLEKGEARSFWLESTRNVELVESIEGPLEVVLLDEEESSPEVVYKAPSITAALHWAASWLKRPLGLTVGIRPAA